MKHSLFVFGCALLMLSLIFYSCTDGSSVSHGVQSGLVVHNDHIAVSLGETNDIDIYGGKGPVSVSSISDTSVIAVVSSGVLYEGKIRGTYLTVRGKRIGAAIVTVTDSAHTATAQIFASVGVIGAFPAAVTLDRYHSTFIYLNGGTKPYHILSRPSETVAVVKEWENGVDVGAAGPGSGDVLIADNAAPPHLISVPVVVRDAPWFTTPGSIAMETDRGQFFVNGILPAPIAFTRSMGEGAGDRIFLWDDYSHTLDGIRMNADGTSDWVFILFDVDQLSPQTFTLSETTLGKNAIIAFGWDLSDTANTSPLYLLTKGTLTISEMDGLHTAGSFQGTGVNIYESPETTHGSITVTSAVFTVPSIITRSDIADLSNAVTAPKKSARTAADISVLAGKIRRHMQKRMKEWTTVNGPISLLRP